MAVSETTDSATLEVKSNDVQKVVTVKATPEEFICFGTIDVNHAECQKCQFNQQCAEKSATK